MLKLGYKASAEQFAPGKLLDFSVHAEKAGFESVFVSDHFQPWKHIDGHAPYSLAWLGALGARTVEGRHRHQRADAHLPLSPLDRGAGLRHPGLDVPGPRHPGRRHRRIAERGAVDRPAMARVQGALRPPARGGEPDAHAVARASASPSRASTTRPRRPRSTTGRTSRCRSTSRRPARWSAKYAGRTGDGFICTSGKKRELYTETLLPKVAEGHRRRRPSATAATTSMIEVKVSFDTDKRARAARTPATGRRWR